MQMQIENSLTGTTGVTRKNVIFISKITTFSSFSIHFSLKKVVEPHHAASYVAVLY